MGNENNKGSSDTYKPQQNPNQKPGVKEGETEEKINPMGDKTQPQTPKK